MSWRRGFFRLWILFASLCLLVATLLAFGQRPYHPDVALVFLTQNPDSPTSFPTYGEDYESLRRMRDEGILGEVKLGGFPEATLFVNTKWDSNKLAVRTAEATAFQATAHAAIISDHRWSMAGTVVFGGIVLPLIVLVLGTAVGWVLSGFRRPTG